MLDKAPTATSHQSPFNSLKFFLENWGEQMAGTGENGSRLKDAGTKVEADHSAQPTSIR